MLAHDKGMDLIDFQGKYGNSLENMIPENSKHEKTRFFDDRKSFDENIK